MTQLEGMEASAANMTDLGQHTTNSGKILAGILITIILLVFILQHFLTPKNDSREPPIATPSVPLIGHLLGIIQYQSNYHKILKYVTCLLALFVRVLTWVVLNILPNHVLPYRFSMESSMQSTTRISYSKFFEQEPRRSKLLNRNLLRKLLG